MDISVQPCAGHIVVPFVVEEILILIFNPNFAVTHSAIGWLLPFYVYQTDCARCAPVSSSCARLAPVTNSWTIWLRLCLSSLMINWIQKKFETSDLNIMEFFSQNPSSWLQFQLKNGQNRWKPIRFGLSKIGDNFESTTCSLDGPNAKERAVIRSECRKQVSVTVRIAMKLVFQNLRMTRERSKQRMKKNKTHRNFEYSNKINWLY